MTLAQYKKKIKGLVKDGQLGKKVEAACINAMGTKYAQTKWLDPAEDNYILPKTVVCAVLQRLSWQYEPLSKQGKKNVQDIKPLIFSL